MPYRYLHRRGEEEFGFHGNFHEVRPDEVIVQTFIFEGVPDGVALAAEFILPFPRVYSGYGSSDGPG